MPAGKKEIIILKIKDLAVPNQTTETCVQKQRKGLKFFQVGIFIVILIAYAIILSLYYLHINGTLNSDDASELILSKLLASQGKLLTQDWYYSTELRVLNTQIIYAFFFKIFDNWHTVRIMSLAVMYVLLVASAYYLCKKLNCQKYGLLFAAMLLMPFSTVYNQIVLKGAYYIPHICISFVGFGLAESFLQPKSKKAKAVLFFLNTILAFVAGMGGPRQLIIFYLPLAAAAFVDLAAKWLKQSSGDTGGGYNFGLTPWALISICDFLGFFIGYIVNAKILSKIYHFSSWNSISYRSFDFGRLQAIIAGFMSSYGFRPNKVFSFATINNGVCIVLIFSTAIAIWRGIKKRSKDPVGYRLSLFSLMMFMVFTALYLFTDMSYTDRYNLPLIVFTIPLLAHTLQTVDVPEMLKEAAAYGFVILVFGTSMTYYREIHSYSSELEAISGELVSQGYCQGYATFWNANVLTELSNGKIEVWDFGDVNDFSGLTTIDDRMFHWLQYVSHDNTNPSGKIFLLLNESQYQSCNWKEVLREENCIYHSESRRIYGYDNFTDFPDELLAQREQPAK